jgi:hypothetical protein
MKGERGVNRYKQGMGSRVQAKLAGRLVARRAESHNPLETSGQQGAESPADQQLVFRCHNMVTADQTSRREPQHRRGAAVIN